MLKKINYNLYDKNSKINKMIPFFIILMFILLNLTIMINMYKKEINNNNNLRLHVVANSNSIEDQIVKLKVYDKVNEYIKNITNNKNTSNSTILSNIKDNSKELLTISNETLKENNIDYYASLNIGKMNYEEKKSILLNMDEGRYTSVKVILGDGYGKNIWTLISPSKENIENIKNLNTILPGLDSLYLNTNENNNNNNNNNYDFKVLEIVNQLKNLI